MSKRRNISQDKRESKKKISKREFKQLSKSKQQKYLQKHGLSVSEARETLKKEPENTFFRQSINKPSLKPKRKTKVDYRLEKIEWLRSQGINEPELLLSVKQIDSIKIKDIRKRSYTPEQLPFLAYLYNDYEKKVQLPSKEHLFFAFRCYSGNISLEDIIPYIAQKSNSELLAMTNELLCRPRTYIKGKQGTSSGLDGEVFTFIGPDLNIMERVARLKNFSTDIKRREKNRKKKRLHTGENIGWQYCSVDGRNIAISSISFREALILYVSLASNITEEDRMVITSVFYFDVFSEYFKNFMHLLPNENELTR